MLSKVVTVSAIVATAVGKIESLAQFYELEVKKAFDARGGVRIWENTNVSDWKAVFNAMLKQGVIFDHERAIDVSNLFNETDDASTLTAGHRRRLSGWKQTALDLHNDLRGDTARGNARNKNGGKWPSSSNMNRLLWDNELARVAQSHVDTCRYGHTDAANDFRASSASFQIRQGELQIGENIAQGGTVESMIQRWYDEHSDGYWTTGSSCSGCGDIGHYTQMVWADTRYVGCGYKQCSGGALLTCNYYPSGNFPGVYAYKTGSPCTQCDKDRNSGDCGDKQCGGCPNPAYTGCADLYTNCGDLARYCPNGCTDSSSDNLCTGCRDTCGTGACPITSRYTGSCSYTA